MRKRKAPPIEYVSYKDVTRSNVPLKIPARISSNPESKMTDGNAREEKRARIGGLRGRDRRECPLLEVPSILQTFIGGGDQQAHFLQNKSLEKQEQVKKLEADLRSVCESGNLFRELEKLRERENFARATAPGGFVAPAPAQAPDALGASNEDPSRPTEGVAVVAQPGPPWAEAGYFYWKFGVEHGNAFRICLAGRAWHVIKEELEERYHLYLPRQQKRSLAYSSFLAFRYEEWTKVCCNGNKRLVYTRPPIEPLEGNVVVKPKDQLVIIRLPVKMVSRLYTEVTRLTFQEEMTEEQRIDALLNFNTSAPAVSNRPHRPRQDPFEGGEFPGPTYRCHNCGRVGHHWKKDCTKGRRLEPKGIPKKFLRRAEKEVADTDHTYVDEEGKAVVIQWAATNKF